MTITDLAKKMRDIDFAMLATHTDGGAIAERPMSNNRDVAYDGDSYSFTSEQTRMVADIERDPRIACRSSARSRSDRRRAGARAGAGRPLRS